MAEPHSTEKSEIALTVSTRTIVKVIVISLATILCVIAARRAAHALLLIFTAIFLAFALNAPVSWVGRRIPGKRRGSRAIATSVSFIVVVLVLGAFIASLTPPIVRQTHTLIQTAPQLIRDTRDENTGIGHFIKRYKLESQVNKFSNELSERLNHASGSAVSTVTKIGSSIFSVLTILVLTFMMLVEGPRWLRLVIQLTPPRRRKETQTVLADMYHVIKGYVNGQVLLAAIASVLILPGLLIFGVSYPIALLGVVFICGLIPMVGHTIGAVIVTLVALFTSPLSAVGILIYYIVYQQVENYLIQPRLQANTTNMSPLLVFASVVIGVSFGGLFGGLVAIPIAGCLRILILDQLRRRDMLDSEAA